MNKKRILGFSMILFGCLIGLTIIITQVLDKLTEPIRTAIGLGIVLGIIIPLVLGGSILSNTAPEFVMKRFKEVKKC